MNPYDGPDGEGFRPDEDVDTDMITMNPPRWQGWRSRRPIAVAGVAAVALAAGGGVGYAATHTVTTRTADTAAVSAASTPTPAPSAVPAPGPPGGRGWHGFPGRMPGGAIRFAPGPIGLGLIHGAFTVPKANGGYQTLDVQRGKVTAVSATSVTVKSADGYTVTYTVTSKTLVDARAAGIGSVKKGDSVFITATASGTTPTAANIADLSVFKQSGGPFGFRYKGGHMQPLVPKKAPAQSQVQVQVQVRQAP